MVQWWFVVNYSYKDLCSPKLVPTNEDLFFRALSHKVRCLIFRRIKPCMCCVLRLCVKVRKPHAEGRKALADPPVHTEVGMQLSHMSSLKCWDPPFNWSAESYLWGWLGPWPFNRTLGTMLSWDKARLMTNLTRIEEVHTFRCYKQSIMSIPSKKCNHLPHTSTSSSLVYFLMHIIKIIADKTRKLSQITNASRQNPFLFFFF